MLVKESTTGAHKLALMQGEATRFWTLAMKVRDIHQSKQAWDVSRMQNLPIITSSDLAPARPTWAKHPKSVQLTGSHCDKCLPSLDFSWCICKFSLIHSQIVQIVTPCYQQHGCASSPRPCKWFIMGRL